MPPLHLSYATTQRASSSMTVTRALVLLVVMLAALDVGLKVYLRGARVHDSADSRPRSTRDAIASTYHTHIDGAMRQVRLASVGVMLAVTALGIANACQERRVSSAHLVVVIGWASLVASFCTTTQMWYSLHHPI